MILSAKYGFISPNEIIQENYNSCFAIKSSKTISKEELRMQIEMKNINEYDNLIVLGGKFYNEMISNLLPDKNILNPLKDCKGIGYMLKKINDSIIFDNKLE